MLLLTNHSFLDRSKYEVSSVQYDDREHFHVYISSFNIKMNSVYCICYKMNIIRVDTYNNIIHVTLHKFNNNVVCISI